MEWIARSTPLVLDLTYDSEGFRRWLAAMERDEPVRVQLGESTVVELVVNDLARSGSRMRVTLREQRRVACAAAGSGP